VPKRGTIGIDIGGTKTLFALFDERFGVLDEVKVKTEADKGEKAFTKKLADALRVLLRTAEKARVSVVTVGVGCAGSVDQEAGTMELVPNIPFLEGYPLRARIAKLVGCPVTLVNDAQAGLYGEFHFGAGVGCRHVLGIFLGTGIGGALILDGTLYVGATGAAGDLGQYLLHPVGPRADGAGTLAEIASRTAIAGDAATLAARQRAPSLAKRAGTDVTKVQSQDLAAAIEQGDTSITDLVRSRAHSFGLAVSNLVSILNPERVVLGGGLVDAMPKLIRAEVEAAIKAYAAPRAKKAVKVAVSTLKSHAVTTGAAKMALDGLGAAARTARTAVPTIS
jgi:glucokinase